MVSHRSPARPFPGYFSLVPVICLILLVVMAAGAEGEQSLWVSAYYGGWSQGCGGHGHLPPDKIDFTALTQVIHFTVFPREDGSLDDRENCISQENSANLVRVAHRAGRKVLLSVGGWMTEKDFLGATGGKNRARFIGNLVDVLVSRGYDGLDIDWEPLSPSSAGPFRDFIGDLRSALDAVRPGILLTAAVASEPRLFAEIQHMLDQIHVMTYDLSGLWLGCTWHNAPLFDGGLQFTRNGGPAPSAEGLVNAFLQAGVEKRKLGIGIAFFGYAWAGGAGTPAGGVTGPGQVWTIQPRREVLNYFDIMDKYYAPGRYRWDEAAAAAYLSVDNAGSSEDVYVSYDDERACSEKVKYVRSKGLGGIFIFQLGGGWMPSAAVPDNLLQTVKKSVLENGPGPGVQTRFKEADSVAAVKQGDASR